MKKMLTMAAVLSASLLSLCACSSTDPPADPGEAPLQSWYKTDAYTLLLPQGFAAPDKGQILACLQAAGSCADPKELGIRRELCLESLLHAMELRDRFTVQKLLEQKGKLSLCAQELVVRYYGG